MAKSILNVVFIGRPEEPFAKILRKCIKDITYVDVMYMNSSDGFKPWEVLQIDFESPVPEWPQYRDWMLQQAQCHETIMKARYEYLTSAEN